MDAIGKLVSARLSGQTVGPHPDPELLAGFAENCLAEPDRQSLLKHLGSCRDCREILYLAAPEVAGIQPVLAFAKRPRWGMRWATLAASVVIIGSVVISNRGTFTRHSAIVLNGAPPEAASANGNSPARTLSSSIDQPIAAGISTRPKQEARVSAPGSASKGRPPLKHMTAKPQANMQFDQSGEVHFAAVPPPATASASTQAATLDSANRSSVYSWNISQAGALQRSADSGKTWQAVSLAGGSPFHAISSIGNDVWVGGNAGALYHSIDAGQHWTKIEPIFGVKRLDSAVTRINFTDTLHGSVGAENGEVWTTSDDGKTWQLQ